MVTDNILSQIPDENLAVHVVWTPVLQSDNYKAATTAHEYFPDERAVFYWDGDQDLGMSYGRTIDLPRGRQLAWDIYFVYGPDVEWGDTVPLPTDWSHQLGIDKRSLGDASRIRGAIESLLAEMK